MQKLFLFILCVSSFLFWEKATAQELRKKMLERTKEKLKNKTEVLNESIKKGNSLIDNEISKMRNGFDTTRFNFAIAISDNAGFYEEKDQKAQAKKSLTRGLDLISGRNAQESKLQEARDWYNLGQMFFGSNAFKKARGCFMQSKRIYEQNGGDNTVLYAQNIASLGLLSQTMGRYSEAEQYTQSALKLYESLSDNKHSIGRLSVVNNLAMLYKDLGKYNEAEQMFDEVLADLESIKQNDELVYAIVLNNKAMLYQAMGRYEKGITLLEKAIKVGGEEIGKKSTTFQRFLINQGLLYQETKRYEEAEKIYLKAIQIKERRLKNKHPDYAYLLNQLASLYVQMGKEKDVEELLTKSIKIYESKFGKQHPAYANSIGNLGNFYRYKGLNDKAEPLLKEALAIRKQTLGEKHPHYVQTQENLATLYWQMNKFQEADALYKQVLKKNSEFIQTYFPPMSENEKAKYWDKLYPSFIKFYAFATQYADKDPSLLVDMFNYDLNNKALLLKSTTKVKQRILASNNPTLIENYQQWINLKEELARAYTLTGEELEEQGINRDSLENVANDLEGKLSASSAEFSQNYEEKPVTFQDIKNQLNANEALIDFIHFQYFDKKFRDTTFYAALIVKKDAAYPELVLLKNGNDLEKKFFAYHRNCIKNKKEDKFSYSNYWQPLEKNIATQNKLYVVLDGIYNQVSINTLRKPEGKYLIDDKSLHFLTNAGDLLKLKKPQNRTLYNKEVVLIGAPEYGKVGNIAPLPGTKTEIENIQKIVKKAGFQTKTYLAHQAEEGVVKQLKNPRILHIATHGYFLGDVEQINEDKIFGIELSKAKANPLLCAGLLLKDAGNTVAGVATDKDIRSKDNGILTAFEVANTDLDNTELAILSACETGLGDIKAGEGVYGLQRAFQMAGVDTLIMSLWTVDDAATQELMTLFYANWIKQGEQGDKSTAFKQAQLQLKAKYKEPYFWGAFILIGE